MVAAENLMAPIVLALLSIIFWEAGRGIIKKIFQKKSAFYKTQNPKQRILYEKEKVLLDIKQEASTIMGQGHIVGRLIKDRILKETRQEAHRILQEAKNDIEKFRAETMNIFQKDMAHTAFMVNQQIQNNFMEYVHSSAKTTQKVINKYLANHPYHSKKSSQVSKLL